MRLMKTNNFVCLPWRYAQVQILVTDISVLKVHYEPLSKSIKNDFIKILRLYFPVAVHTRCEFFPFYIRYIHSAWVVIRIFWPSLHGIFDVFLLCEPWTKLVFFNYSVHILPSNTLVSIHRSFIVIIFNISSFK